MATQTIDKVTKKSFVSGLKIQFGVMETTGNLYTPLVANAKKSEKTRMCCPVHAIKGEAVPVSQRYVCTESEDGVFEPYECAKGKEDGDEMILVDKNALQAAKEASDLPEKTLILTAHEASDVAAYLVHTGGTYVFQPEGESNFYGILLRILDDAGFIQTDTGPKVLMGEALIRK